MNKTEARQVRSLLRWLLEEPDLDASHTAYDLAHRVHAALGDGPDQYEISRRWAEVRPQVTHRRTTDRRPQWLIDHEHEQRRQEQEKARVDLEPWMDYLGTTFVGETLSARQPYVYRRVAAALGAVRRWRQVSNTLGDDYETEGVAVRVTAEALAGQIDAAATARQDPGTIAWVVAGLRCRRRPFCTGCGACQTVTSPHREFTAGGVR